MVVGITGHQNIPSNALVFVKTGITRVLRRHIPDLIGLSSLAVGADQLFAETVLEIGGCLHAIIPCKGYDTTFRDPDGLNRFRHLLASAEQVETLSHSRPSEEAFLDAGKRIVNRSQLLVAVWDGRDAKGKGGTADVVRYARDQNTKVVVVWPSGTVR